MVRIIFLGVVIYVIFLILKSIFGNKNTRNDYDQGSRQQPDILTDDVKEEIRARQAAHNENPSRTIPSWMNTDQVHEFDSAVFRILRQDGIALEDSKRLMNHRKTYMAALYVAGNLEQKGASFVQQQLAAGDALIALWRRSNHSQLFADDDF